MKNINDLEIDVDRLIKEQSIETKKMVMAALSRLSKSQIEDIDDYEMGLIHTGHTWQFKATKSKPGEIGTRSVDVLHDYITPYVDSKFSMR